MGTEFLHKPQVDSLCAIGTPVESILLNIHHINHGMDFSLTVRIYSMSMTICLEASSM